MISPLHKIAHCTKLLTKNSTRHTSPFILVTTENIDKFSVINVTSAERKPYVETICTMHLALSEEHKDSTLYVLQYGR